MRKWYKFELNEKEWRIFKIFLKVEDHHYRASLIRDNWINVELFANAKEVEKMNKCLQMIDEYGEML